MTTRESYLATLIEDLRPLFEDAGFPLPHTVYRVSIGFPSRNATSAKNRAIGQCWNPDETADGSIHIFISPVVKEVAEIAAVLVHELCHAAVGTECGHKGDFITCMKAVGLTGKPTHTVAGDALKLHLDTLIASAGEFPHEPLVLTEKVPTKKSDNCRQKKVYCAPDDYIVRVSRQTLTKGFPICPVCREPMVEERKRRDDDDSSGADSGDDEVGGDTDL